MARTWAEWPWSSETRSPVIEFQISMSLLPSKLVANLPPSGLNARPLLPRALSGFVTVLTAR